MAGTRRAVIDIGTNSVKLLIADVQAHAIAPLREESKQTRLGQGFYETHRLLRDAIENTATAVAEFAATAREHHATHVRVIATSAARDASNATELVAAVEKAAALPVEIISGEQEADWAFQGITTDPALAEIPILLVDVGGGSTEFILGAGEQKHYRQSFRLGTVRLLETIPHSDPPTPGELAETRDWVRRFFSEKVHGSLHPALVAESHLAGGHSPVTLIGTGGTTTILARMEARLETYDRTQIEKTHLPRERIEWHTQHLWSMPLAQREAIVGLPRKRADVILTGAVIFEALMQIFGFETLRVTTRGLRFAAVMETP